MHNKVYLVRVFNSAIIDLCELYQDFAYLSYARNDDIAGAHKIIFDDLDRVKAQVDKLIQLASDAAISLDAKDVEVAIHNIKENLLQINSLDDVDRFVLYRDGELFQNDLLDIWADKLQLALHQLYYQL
ncbi:MAG TPA: hypothetical protein VLA72_00480, partial [Anaerolineales bacterium]|nr:hypothetical protein [Anaerolineales bacterium]